MKRSEFIKNILATIGISALPVTSVKYYDKFYLLHFFVRGFAYYEGPKLLAEMKTGAMLELVREPENKFDSKAVALNYNSKKIGFVPAESNELLARLMDINMLEFMAEITNLKPEEASWQNVAVAVYVLKEREKEKMLSKNAKHLTQLETPYYHSINFSDDSVVRIYEAEDYEYDPFKS